MDTQQFTLSVGLAKPVVRPAPQPVSESEAVLAVLAYAAQGPECVYWCEAWFNGCITVDDTTDEAWKYLEALAARKHAPALSPAAADLLRRAHFDADLFNARMAERAHVSLMLDSLEAAERDGTAFSVLAEGRTLA